VYGAQAAEDRVSRGRGYAGSIEAGAGVPLVVSGEEGDWGWRAEGQEEVLLLQGLR
jgi:hypothetical protein